MDKSPSIKAIAAALLEFQKEVVQPHKTETADTGKFKYTYLDLGSMIEHCKPLLIKNGLVFTSCGLRSLLMHVPSGEWISGEFACELSGLDAQKCGAAGTYARRYNLQGLLNICAEEDDDAASAKPAPAKTYPLKAMPTPPPKVAPIPGSGPYNPQAAQPKAAPVADDGGNMLQATVVATSKARNDGGAYGILIKDGDHQGSCPKTSDPRGKCSCGAERWLNTFHDTPWNTAKTLKGQQGVFTLSAPNDKGYQNVEDLVGVSA